MPNIECTKAFKKFMFMNSPTVACTLLENFTDDAIASLYVTNCSTISLNLTKLYASHRAFVIIQMKRIPPTLSFNSVQYLHSPSLIYGVKYIGDPSPDKKQF